MIYQWNNTKPQFCYRHPPGGFSVPNDRSRRSGDSLERPDTFGMIVHRKGDGLECQDTFGMITFSNIDQTIRNNLNNLLVASTRMLVANPGKIVAWYCPTDIF